jgi:hypothetical protein
MHELLPEPLLMVVRLIWRKILSEMRRLDAPLRTCLLQTLFRPLEFLSSGPATSGDSLHLLQETAKSSKSYEPIVAKCIRL